MTLIRWSPWRELESMQRHLSRVLDDSSLAPGMEEGHWLPAVDIRETADAIVVHAELPGIDKKDVKVDVKDGVLTISGERKYEKDVKEENVHRIERSYGSFSRSFSLPTHVDVDKVQARLEDGVLEVRLPKTETAKPKSIDVQ
ncbi:MAG TPA: Hsp20/alpha crystallin family protein [Mariprofundaceae bacterium]|nr:Hsp20/alpha crystallin family protein [Mariprofundaceae bacterium]